MSDLFCVKCHRGCSRYEHHMVHGNGTITCGKCEQKQMDIELVITRMLDPVQHKLKSMQQELRSVKVELDWTQTINKYLRDRVLLLEHTVYKDQREQLFQDEKIARSELLQTVSEAEILHTHLLESMHSVWEKHVHLKEAMTANLRAEMSSLNFLDQP